MVVPLAGGVPNVSFHGLVCCDVVTVCLETVGGCAVGRLRCVP